MICDLCGKPVPHKHVGRPPKRHLACEQAEAARKRKARKARRLERVLRARISRLEGELAEVRGELGRVEKRAISEMVAFTPGVRETHGERK